MFYSGFSSGAYDTGSGSGSMWGNLISDITDATTKIIGAIRRPDGSTGSSYSTAGAGAGYTAGAAAGAPVSSYGLFLIGALLVALYLVFRK